MFKGVIFDFSGVLIIDSHWHEVAWEATLAAASGRIPSQVQTRTLQQGRPGRQQLQDILGRMVSDRELGELYDDKESRYRQLCVKAGSRFGLSPGSEDLLFQLKDLNLPLSIASTTGEHNLRFFFDRLHLGRWFAWEKLVYDNGTLAAKPSPDVYLRAAEKLRLKPADCIVFEDTVSGLQAARTAGAGHVVAVTGRMAPLPDVVALADSTVPFLGNFNTRKYLERIDPAAQPAPARAQGSILHAGQLLR